METVVFDDSGVAFAYTPDRDSESFLSLEITPHCGEARFDLYGSDLLRFVVAGLRVLAQDAQGVELGRLRCALGCVGPLVEEEELF